MCRSRRNTYHYKAQPPSATVHAQGSAESGGIRGYDDQCTSRFRYGGVARAGRRSRGGPHPAGTHRSARFSAPAAYGTRVLADWMHDPGVLMVINGSFYGPDGSPDTPVLSGGVRLGPASYMAEHGALVASDAFTGIHNITALSVYDALVGMRDAVVSYPLLLAADGSTRTEAAQFGLGEP